MTDSAERDGRQAGEFTEKEGRIHQAGFKVIHDGLKNGLGFDDACSGLRVVDPQLRLVIIDDYLKVTLAERHFQGGESLPEVADSLKVAVERVEAAREEMLREVQKTAVDAYREEASRTGLNREGLSGGPPGKKTD